MRNLNILYNYVVIYESYVTHICSLHVAIYVKIYEFCTTLVCQDICDMHATCKPTHTHNTYMKQCYNTLKQYHSNRINT